MNKEITEILERTLVEMLNNRGWEIWWIGDSFEHWDAYGRTPKGTEAIIEIKIRQQYYQTKMIERYKYEKLTEASDHALYLVSDPKGIFIFWLNRLFNLKEEQIECPDKTLWQTKKIKKSVYLLPEKHAYYLSLD